MNSLASSDYSTVTGSTTSLALRRRHVGKNKGSWGQDEYESAEMASFHELAAVIGPEEAASDRLAAQRRAQGTGAIIKQALRLGRDNPVRKATTRVRPALDYSPFTPTHPLPRAPPRFPSSFLFTSQNQNLPSGLSRMSLLQTALLSRYHSTVP